MFLEVVDFRHELVFFLFMLFGNSSVFFLYRIKLLNIANVLNIFQLSPQSLDFILIFEQQSIFGVSVDDWDVRNVLGSTGILES